MKKLLLYFFCLVFLNACDYSVKQVSKETEIALQPFEDIEKSWLDSVKSSLIEVYGIKVNYLEPIDLPAHAFINVKSPRYRADTLIRFLRDDPQFEDFEYVLGITKKDISTTKYSNYANKTVKEPAYKYQDWGIFGLGFRPGKSCIVSTHRMLKNTTKVNFIQRLKKISCHEMGHNFGLPHCPNKDCIMQDAAETIKTIDNVKLNLCEDCKQKIGLD